MGLGLGLLHGFEPRLKPGNTIIGFGLARAEAEAMAGAMAGS